MAALDLDCKNLWSFEVPQSAAAVAEAAGLNQRYVEDSQGLGGHQCAEAKRSCMCCDVLEEILAVLACSKVVNLVEE